MIKFKNKQINNRRILYHITKESYFNDKRTVIRRQNDCYYQSKE